MILRDHLLCELKASQSAVFLLKRDALATKNDAYSNQAKDKLQQMLDDLDQKRLNKNAEDLQQMESKEREDDMDALFGQKKKW
ncbi:hypothetical protein [Vibrio lentus]|uniref:Uncharacterized protein n=1 Tax=Vibrio lentus TaxID=136468 RepID=A0A2N7IMT9_9VIBR|nr:hypothetical protein BCT74_02900 [Vibrio lentus]PMM29618.1 hypothetical protein BCT58_04115 [Vibrio lentus]